MGRQQHGLTRTDALRLAEVVAKNGGTLLAHVGGDRREAHRLSTSAWRAGVRFGRAVAVWRIRWAQEEQARHPGWTKARLGAEAGWADPSGFGRLLKRVPTYPEWAMVEAYLQEHA